MGGRHASTPTARWRTYDTKLSSLGINRIGDKGRYVQQDEYIAILFHDLGFTDTSRKAWLNVEYNTRYVSTLSVQQKSALIDRLKEMKDGR